MKDVMFGIGALVAGSLVLASPCASGAQQLKVLMIGNSFSSSVMDELPAAAAATGECELDIVNMFIGGCTLERHWDNVERAAEDPAFKPYSIRKSYAFDEDRGKAIGEKGNIPDLLVADRWDVVTIQQGSQDSPFYEKYQPYADRLIAKIRELAPQAKILIQQTWSYSPYEDSLASWSMTPETMHKAVRDAYARLVRKHSLELIPVGDAVAAYRRRLPVRYERLLTKTELDGLVRPQTVDLFGDVVGSSEWKKGWKGQRDWDQVRHRLDAKHLNRAGKYLQACVWLAKLFAVDVTSLKYEPDIPGFSRKAQLIRQCAAEAVADGGNDGRRVERLLSGMTLEEKIGQLNQVAPGYGKNPPPAEELVRSGACGSFVWMKNDVRERNRLQRIAVEKSRLGVPILFANDFIHGTDLTFPIAPALAGTFEPDLLERIQSVAAAESKAKGVDWMFAPMCDLAIDPRWGRVAETCGEDPYLSSLCNAAQVRGIQGQGVAACMKHFVGYSAAVGGRDYADTPFSSWDLHSKHLPAFIACVKEGCLTTMSAFGSIDGLPLVNSAYALKDVLRGELGFAGPVVSDWMSVPDALRWGTARDEADAARLALQAGVDIDMSSGFFSRNLAACVNADRIRQERLDEAVRRVLTLKSRLGLFECPYADEAASGRLCDELGDFRRQARRVAREAVAKSVVLLTNHGVLPFDRSRIGKVALVGPMGDDPIEMIGCWEGHGRKETVVTLKGALTRLLGPDGLLFARGCPADAKPTAKTLQDGSVVENRSAGPFDGTADFDEAMRVARNADVVVLAVGETCGVTGEDHSRSRLDLTGCQEELFRMLQTTGKPIVTIVFSGRPLALPEVWKKSTAVLYAWQPGSEAGNGLADILFGKVSPSARLSMSVPRSSSQVPCAYNRPLTHSWMGGKYEERPDGSAAYPFGYGLTYGRFEYTSPRVDGETIVCEVKNVGTVRATETPQLYVRANYCSQGWRPRTELRGFCRVTLEPGESSEVRFVLSDEVLGFVGRDGRMAVDADVRYRLRVSGDSESGETIEYSR